MSNAQVCKFRPNSGQQRIKEQVLEYDKLAQNALYEMYFTCDSTAFETTKWYQSTLSLYQ